MDIKPTARVTLVTTKGKIEIELFPKELPLLCKQFISNCVNKKYVGLEFAKVTPSLIQSLQIESSTQIKREKNSRIKFNPRGAVGLLRLDGTRFSSASGFFISLDSPSEYDSGYSFIGNVVGESIYNVVKIKDSEVKPGTEAPLYPVTITDCYASEPYFGDLEERTIAAENNKRKKQKTAITLDYEMEGDEETEDSSNFVVRSAHELLSERKQSKPKGTETHKEKNPKSQNLTETIPDTDSSQKSNEAKADSSSLVKNTEVKSRTKTIPEAVTENEKPSEIQSHSPKQAKPVRDFSIDPYDPELDFSEDEITYETLRKHKFICR